MLDGIVSYQATSSLRTQGGRLLAQIIKDASPILALMAIKGINQAKLCILTGIENSKMSLALNGKRSVPLTELARIAAVFETDWRNLLSVYGLGDGPTLPPPTAIEARVSDLEAKLDAVLSGLTEMHRRLAGVR